MTTLHLNEGCDLQKVFDSLSPYTTIYLGKGTYLGKFKLSTPFVTIIGEGDETVISNGDYAKMQVNGTEIGTFQTYTLVVTANNVSFQNLCIENTAGNPSIKGQQVALSVYGDKFSAKNCTFKSTQDTLFIGPLPDDLVIRYDGFLPDYLRYYEGQTFMRFTACRIEGTVDFIFGCANALFEDCLIASIDDGRDIGYVAAPSHHLASDIGFVFLNCNLVSKNAPDCYLARAWRDFGKATFLYCSYQSHINKVGFINWQGTEREKTARFSEYSDQKLEIPNWCKRLNKEQADRFIKTIMPRFNF